MPAKLLIPKRANATGSEYDGTFDGTASPPAVHPLTQPSLTAFPSEAASPSTLPKSKRASLLTPAVDKAVENLERVILVFVNSEEVQTLNCVRRVNSDEIQGDQAVEMEELIAAGYVPVGLLVWPPSDRIEEFMDDCDILRWPAETWESCRSVEESKGFIGHVAEEPA